MDGCIEAKPRFHCCSVLISNSSPLCFSPLPRLSQHHRDLPRSCQHEMIGVTNVDTDLINTRCSFTRCEKSSLERRSSLIYEISYESSPFSTVAHNVDC